VLHYPILSALGVLFLCVGNANAPFLLGLYNVRTSPVALGGR